MIDVGASNTSYTWLRERRVQYHIRVPVRASQLNKSFRHTRLLKIISGGLCAMLVERDGERFFSFRFSSSVLT